METALNPAEIARERDAIAERYGPWTNHNIRLADGVYTISPEVSPSQVKAARFLQAIADLTGRTAFEGLRVLDLACLEGLYGLEFALHGATVVGIEGREANLAKARFAREVLALDNIEFYEDDVRNLNPDTYGRFDIVICCGIFYHLDVPDLFEFAANIARVCDRFLLLDTHVAAEETDSERRSHLWQSRKYWGLDYREETETLWSSIGNTNSVWLTRPSLFNLLGDVGFTSVCECRLPLIPKYEIMRANGDADRNTFFAIKGRSMALKTTPEITPRPRWSEST